MGIVTVVSSGKGGVGKSTATVSLGRALAKRGKRVLLIDCDAGLRTLDKLAFIEEALVYDISDVAKAKCAPIEAIYPCGNQDGLFVMPAAANVSDMPSQKVMEKLVPLLKKYYDHVVLDSPAGLGKGFRAAACSADRALVICTPDPVCIRASEKAGRLLKDLSVHKQRLIINRFNENLFEEIKVLEDLDKVIDEVGIKLLGVIPDEYNFVASILKGEQAPKKSKGNMAVERIVARLEGQRLPLLLD